VSNAAYRQKAEAKIEEYQAKLMVVRARLKGSSADAMLGAEKHIRELEKQIDAGRRKLTQLGDSAEEAWTKLGKGLDDAWQDTSQRIKTFLDR
jgi:chromosome segregation ATPase